MRTVRLRYRVEVVDWSVMYYGSTRPYEVAHIFTVREEAEHFLDIMRGRICCAATLTEEEY